MKTIDSIVESRIKKMLPLLDEKQKRIYLATEVEGLGYGGLKAVHELTRVSQTTISRGKKELREGTIEHNRIRKHGGGWKPIVQKYGTIQKEIERIIGNNTRGNPEKVIVPDVQCLLN
ncbi:MAG: hypothetical protein LBF75_04015 [Treponema sp.]|nr:hypothetical protein [Treponema sp.]